MQLRLIGFALFGSLLVSATASSQPPEMAELQVPVGQIQAYCDDLRQAMDSCLAGQGVASAQGQPLSDRQIEARRACREQTEFDLYTASFCPGARTGMPATEYAAMCVQLNQQTLPCLRQLGYQAVIGRPLTPEDHAYLYHCREQAGADMQVARRRGPPAFSHAP